MSQMAYFNGYTENYMFLSPSFCFPLFDADELLLPPFPVCVMEVALAVRSVSVLTSEVEFSSIR
jgi:hypothetical protein